MSGTDPGDDPSLPLSEIERVVATCDRFEAAWRAGQRPRAEDYLGGLPDPDRPALLRELLAMELVYRRLSGEVLEEEEFRRRFPGHDAVVDSVFPGEQPAPPGPIERPKADRPRAEADRGLLLAILALQNNFIDRDMLLAAFNAWVADKSRALGQILVERGALSGDEHALLEALVGTHLKKYGDDPERSLAALGATASFRRDLGRIADRDLYASLAHTPLDRGVTSRFRILRLHAEGGLGQVSVALDEALHREVALKEIQDRYADDAESRARFLLEAEITGNLEHPGIVPIYSLGHDDGRPFYVMQFIRGDSLKQAIERFHRDEVPGRDPGERTLALRELFGRFIAACNAIAYAHSRGVLHRDLKPSNIILGKYGATLVVDWGLAKPIGRPEGVKDASEVTLRPSSAGGSAETLTGSAIGTPQYMSPEQAAGRLDLLGTASDVYSLGATLYCLLTGRAPFEDRVSNVILQKVQRGDFPPPRQVKRGVAPALEAICLKAMALRPEDRYPSPRDLAEDIEHWLADESVLAYPEGWGRRLARWARHHRTWTQAGAAALLVVTLVSVGAALLVNEARNQERAARGREDRLRRLAETRVAALRAEGQALIQKGQDALGGKDWQDARLQLSKALATAAPELQLADLKAHADDLLALADRRLAEQAAREREGGRVKQFRLMADQVWFYAASTDPVAERVPYYDLRRGVAAGQAALALARAWGPGLERLPLPEERAPLKEELYDLLLLMVQARSRDCDGPEAARELLALLDEARSLHEPSRSDHRLRALCYRLLGDSSKAVEEQRRADDPRTLATALDHFLLGENDRREAITPRGAPAECATWQPNRDALAKAIGRYRRALECRPDHYWSHFQLGRCYLGLGQRAEAVEALGTCVALRPDCPWGYSARGLALALQGRSREAEQDLDRAIDLSPDFPPARLNRGVASWLGKKYEAALADFGKVLQLPEGQRLIEAAFYRGQLLMERGKYPEALDDFDRLVAEDPGFRPVYRLRALAHLLQGRDELCLEDLDVLLAGGGRSAPRGLGAHERRGRLLFLLAAELPPPARPRAWALARAELEEAVALGGRSATLFAGLGAVREHLGQLEEAIRAYSTGLEQAPKDTRLLIQRGWAYERLKREDEARSDFGKALRVDARNAEAHIGLGYAHACLGAPADAQREASLALVHGADDYLAVHNVACIYAELSRADSGRATEHLNVAMRLLRRAVELRGGGTAGPDEIELIRGEQAFPAALRARPDFQKLIAGGRP